MSLLGYFGAFAAGAIVKKIYDNEKEKRREEERRKNTPVQFVEPLTQELFEQIAHYAVKSIKKRKIDIVVEDAVIYGTVKSNTQLSEWNFTADFNDYGWITGRYWLTSDNKDSSVPSAIADYISKCIAYARNNL